jgi:hypothetical protein
MLGEHPMKLTRLRTLAAAGTVAGTLAGAVMLTAPQASAMTTSQWVQACTGEGGVPSGFRTYYNFDLNGNVASIQLFALCRIDGVLHSNNTDLNGVPEGGY